MRKIIVCSIAACLILTGCKGLKDTKNSFEDTFKWMDDGNNFFPEEYYEGGEQYFGNGKTEDDSDIFSVIERKIWGDD